MKKTSSSFFAIASTANVPVVSRFDFGPTHSSSGSPLAVDVFEIPHHGKQKMTLTPKTQNIEGAVFAHIKAVRALGHTEVNTDQIAAALSVPVSAVNAAITKLRDKGVKQVRSWPIR